MLTRNPKHSKIILSFCFLIFTFSLIACSGTKITRKTSDLKKAKYFRILADADDDYIFVKLQDDLGIDPKMERYTVIIDIRNTDESLNYILFGDEYKAIKFLWLQLSEQVRKGLVNWTGTNKENLE